MNKKIITLIILLIIGAGAWFIVTKTQPVNVPVEDPSLAGGIMLEGTAVPLEGTTFRLVQHNGVATPDDSNYSLTLNNGQLSARFCNQMGGNYTIKGNVIWAPELMSTLMFCESPAGLMDMESGFGLVMSEGAVFKLEGDLLELTSISGTHTFLYNVPGVIAQ